MKFSQLKVGDHFVLGGETYVKHTPLVANHVGSGQQKMVPRYMSVELVSNSPGGSDTDADIKTPQQALDFFIDVLGRAIASSPLSDAAKALVVEEMQKARMETLSRVS